MKILLIAAMFLLANNFLFSQEIVDTAADSNSTTLNNPDREFDGNNNLYLEGSFFLQSINFETKLYRSESNSFQINGRFGLGYFLIDFFGKSQSAGGLAGLTFLLGRKNNHFETSLGGFIGSENGVSAWPIASLGYKYQKPEGGFIFRSNIGTLGVGIGLGYAF
ncbi:MAG: hypothetical protein ACJA0X_001151 [Cyclobacteriaceae bacterium]|jgi:hypothetical protein